MLLCSSAYIFKVFDLRIFQFFSSVFSLYEFISSKLVFGAKIVEYFGLRLTELLFHQRKPALKLFVWSQIAWCAFDSNDKITHTHTQNAFKSLLSFNATGFAELCLFLGIYLFNRLKGEANDLLHNKKKGSFQSLYFRYVNNKQIENNVYVVFVNFVHSNWLS